MKSFCDMFFLYTVVISSYLLTPGEYTSAKTKDISSGDATIYECRFHDFTASDTVIKITSSELRQLYFRHCNFYSLNSIYGTISVNSPLLTHLYACGFSHCSSDNYGAIATFTLNSGLPELGTYQHSFQYVTARECSGQYSPLYHKQTFTTYIYRGFSDKIIV